MDGMAEVLTDVGGSPYGQGLAREVALSGRDSGGKKCYPTVKRRPGLGAGYVT